MSVSTPSQGTHFSDGVRTGPIIGSSFTSGANVLSPSVMVSSPIDQLPPGVFNAPMGILDIVVAPPTLDSVMPAFNVPAAGYLPLVNTNGVGITIITYKGIPNVIQLDSARVLTIKGLAGGVTAVNYFIFGWDQYGMPLVEQINGPADTNQHDGNKAFLYIQAIYASAGTTGNVSIGVGNTYGLPYYINTPSYIIASKWEDIYQDDNSLIVVGDPRIATATTGDVRGTVKPSTSSAIDERLIVFYYPASADAQKYNLSSSGSINLVLNSLGTGIGLNTVSVSHRNHQLTQGEIINISGAISFNGLTASQLNISAPVDIKSADLFNYTVSGSAATGTGFGGGNEIVLTPNRGNLYSTPIGRFGVTQYSVPLF